VKSSKDKVMMVVTYYTPLTIPRRQFSIQAVEILNFQIL